MNTTQRSVALMYHALYPDNDISQVDIEDQPYAVSVSTFTRHLELLNDYRVGLLSNDANAVQPDVVLTFDDGHISNHSLALPLLQKFGFKAYFFVTTEFIESRPNHCRPEQLRDLTAAGMVVGSHGVTHRFLADLPIEEAKRELVHSRQSLQDWLGDEVSSISYPGGRYNDQTMVAAQAAGYQQVFDSSFDTVSATDLAQHKPLARVAIRRSTNQEDFLSMISNDSTYYRRVQRTQRIKQSVKRLLGNRLYHGLYKSLSAR